MFSFTQRIYIIFLVLLASVCGSLGIVPYQMTEPTPYPEPEIDLNEPYLFDTDVVYTADYYKPGGADPEDYAYGYHETDEYLNYYFYYTEEEAYQASHGEHIESNTEWLAAREKARENVEKEIEIDGFKITLYKNRTAAIFGVTKNMKTLDIPAFVNGYRVVMIHSLQNDDLYSRPYEKVIIPDTVEYIDGTYYGSSVCNHCFSLKELRIGRRVRFIGDGAFSDCHNLRTVQLPDSVEYIGCEAFARCTMLSSLTFGQNLRVVNDAAFEACKLVKDVTLPEKLEYIGAAAFYNCNALQYVYIPASVTIIDDNAFSQNIRLTTIHGEKGTCAEEYAKQRNILFVVGK